MNELLSESPLYLPTPLPINSIVTDKGTQIMNRLLLSQYTNSSNLQEYYTAFIAELDLLFEQNQRVYYGRFIEVAEGAQLDIIGEILQQTRSVILEKDFFGFVGVPLVKGMADELTPANGGIFKDESIGEGDITVLSDNTYRRMLMAKAAVLNRDTIDSSLAYFIISTILGRVPSVFELRDADSTPPTSGERQVNLHLSVSAVTLEELGLILYMSKYFIPEGVTFNIVEEV